MTIKRRDFQKAAALIHEFLLKLSEDVECAELRDSLNLALLHMQRYYRLLRSRHQNLDRTNGGFLTQSLRGLSPMTPFRDAPDKFQWRWINLDNPKLLNDSTLPPELNKELSTLPPVILAAKDNNNDMLMQLLEQDANCVYEIDGLGRTALMYAVHFGHLDMVQNLLEQNIDINASAHDGSTAMHYACHNGNHEALQILLNYNANLADQDTQGRAPIHWACANANRDCVKLLIDHEADVSLRDHEGMTPSMWACRMDHIDHFELLSRAQHQSPAEEDGLERDNMGRTWLHWSVRRTEPLQCLETLLNENAASLPDEDGKTVMHVAAELGALAAAKLILEHGGMSCLEHRDHQNRTPLILATMGGHGELVNYLLAQGADLACVDDFGATAWRCAMARRFNYCMLIIASYIRERAREEGQSGEENGPGFRRSQPDLVNGPLDDTLGIDDLRIAPQNGEMSYYPDQPYYPQPTPPSHPQSPNIRTPRTPRGSVTPRTPRSRTPVTPRGAVRGGPPMQGQHPVTQMPATPRTPATPRSSVSTPRGYSMKRSPGGPESNGDMMFERNERLPGTAGTKRMRNESRSPERERETLMSVMSVESMDNAPSSHQSSAHNSREMAPPDEPEMLSESHYIDGPHEDHAEEEKSVSIDAMDVSEFEAEAGDIEEEEEATEVYNTERHYSPHRGSPPPPSPSHSPPHPQPRYQPAHNVPQQQMQLQQQQQQQHFMQQPQQQHKVPYSKMAPRPPPSPPYHSQQVSPHQVSHNDYVEHNDGYSDGGGGDAPHASHPRDQSAPQPSPRSRSMGVAGTVQAGAANQQGDSPNSLGSDARSSSTDSQPSPDSPKRGVSPQPKLAPLKPLAKLAPIAGSGSDSRTPPAHLSPLPPPSPTRKKKKKKKHRERLQSPHERSPHPMPPPRGYAAPVNPPQSPPEVVPQQQQQQQQQRERSPPRGYVNNPPPSNPGYAAQQQQLRGPGPGLRGQNMKPAPKKRVNPQQQQQQQQRFPLDQPLKVKDSREAGPPVTSHTPPLPQALPRPKAKLERRGAEDRPRPHSPHPSHRPPNEHYDEDENEMQQDGPRTSMPSQGSRPGSGSHRFPAQIQNGTVHNGPSPREPSPRRAYPPQKNDLGRTPMAAGPPVVSPRGKKPLPRQRSGMPPPLGKGQMANGRLPPSYQD